MLLLVKILKALILGEWVNLSTVYMYKSHTNIYCNTKNAKANSTNTEINGEQSERERKKNNTNTDIELTSEQFGYLLKCQRALKQFRSANQITIFFFTIKIIYFFGFGCVFNFRLKRSRKKKTIALANRMWLRVYFESKRDHVKV